MINGNKPPIRYGFQDATIVNRLMETKSKSLIMACLQIYQELLSLTTFFQVHSNSEEVSYLSWQNTYPNLKTTCHVKVKFFLWTKLLENLLLAQYLISVAAPFKNDSSLQGRS